MWIIVLSNNSVFNWDFQIIMDHNINQLNNTPKPMGTKIALKSLYGWPISACELRQPINYKLNCCQSEIECWKHISKQNADI